MSKKSLYIVGCIISLMLCTSAYAANGDWSALFTIGPNHNIYVRHTPTMVCINDMICGGEGIDIEAKSFNGVPLTSCGLHLNTDSTKQEFIAAMNCAGVNPVEVG